MKTWNNPEIAELNLEETAGGWLPLTTENTHSDYGCIGKGIDKLVAGLPASNPEDNGSTHSTGEDDNKENIQS